MRENQCRPCGTRLLFQLLPGTSVPGFHMPPLRGWISVGFYHRSSRNLVLTHRPKAHTKKKGFIATLKALRHPRATFPIDHGRLA